MTAAPLLQLPPGPVRTLTPVPPPEKRHSCADCFPLRPGSRMCHCSVCHHTFTGVAPFDRHQPSRHGCRHPADVGLIRNSRGVWGRPQRDKETAA